MEPEYQCAELFLRNHKRLLSLCANACKGHVDEANDLLQDIMINVWQQWDTIRSGASQRELDSWLMFKSRTVIYNSMRHRHLRWVPLDTVTITDYVDTSHERMESIMESLDGIERELLDLLLQGYNSREIAEKRGLKHSTQRKQIYRLFEKIRKKEQNK